MIAAIVFVLGPLLLATATANQVPITVRRCCPLGQKLNQNLECVPTWSGNWTQTVITRNLKELVAIEDAVKRWRVVVERPSCFHSDVVAFPNVLLIEDGTLWLREQHINDGKSFCVADDEAIICRDDEVSTEKNTFRALK